MKWFKITLKEPADDACRTVRHALEDAMLFGDAPGVRLVVSSVEEADTTVIHLSPQFTAKAPQLVDQFSGVECDAPLLPTEKEEVDPVLFPQTMASGGRPWRLTLIRTGNSFAP